MMPEEYPAMPPVSEAESTVSREESFARSMDVSMERSCIESVLSRLSVLT